MNENQTPNLNNEAPKKGDVSLVVREDGSIDIHAPGAVDAQGEIVPNNMPDPHHFAFALALYNLSHDTDLMAEALKTASDYMARNAINLKNSAN